MHDKLKELANKILDSTEVQDFAYEVAKEKLGRPVKDGGEDTEFYEEETKAIELLLDTAKSMLRRPN